MIPIPVLTFCADLDGAGGPDLVAVLVPLSRHVDQRNLAHEHGILVLLDVNILQLLHYLQLMRCQMKIRDTERCQESSPL